MCCCNQTTTTTTKMVGKSTAYFLFSFMWCKTIAHKACSQFFLSTILSIYLSLAYTACTLTYRMHTHTRHDTTYSRAYNSNEFHCDWNYEFIKSTIHGYIKPHSVSASFDLTKRKEVSISSMSFAVVARHSIHSIDKT